MPTDKELKQLVINVLTEEQYASATKNEDELYLTPSNEVESLEAKLNLKQNRLVADSDGSIVMSDYKPEDGDTYTQIASKVRPSGSYVNSLFHIEAKTYEVGDVIYCDRDTKYSIRGGLFLGPSNLYTPVWKFKDSSGIVVLVQYALDSTFPTNYAYPRLIVLKGGTVAEAHDENIPVDGVVIKNS